MKERRNHIMTIIMLAMIFIAFAGAGLVGVDKYYSEKENRPLTLRPEFTVESFLRGEFARQYEAYARDQFVSRDKWTWIKMGLDRLSLKQELSGVYMGKDNYLFLKRDSEYYKDVNMQEKLDRLASLTAKWNAKVMPVPGADGILTDKLPAYAPVFDQRDFLNTIYETVGEENYIDIFTVLNKHRDEKLYYYSDEHWTSLAAFYGYQTWVENAGKPEYPYTEYAWTEASDALTGPLQNRLNMEWEADTVLYMPQTDRKLVSVTYDFRKEADSLYADRWLESQNVYGFFMDDSHMFTEIHTNRNRGDRLFILKGSYANCMIPFLLPHYDTIYVLDMANCSEADYNMYLSQYARLGKKPMDVLILSSVYEFIENF